MALSKFLVLLAIFLSANNANAFTSVSLVAENQVQVNHSIQFEPSHEPTNYLINDEITNQRKQRLEQDTLLPGNLSPKKTQVAGSKPKQDAELPSKISNTQLVSSYHNKKSEQVGNCASTQLVGSCHNKKSEQVGNCASTQLVGSCHDDKSEQVGSCASTQSETIGPCSTRLSDTIRTCSTNKSSKTSLYPHFIWLLHPSQTKMPYPLVTSLLLRSSWLLHPSKTKITKAQQITSL